MTAWALGFAIGQAAATTATMAHALFWRDDSPFARIISAIAIAMNGFIAAVLAPVWWAAL